MTALRRVVVSASLVGIAACGRQADNSLEVRRSALSTFLAATVPAGVDLSAVSLAAGHSLTVGDRTNVSGPVSNTGAGTSSVGISTVAGSITSVGAVILGNDSHVTGSVSTGSSVSVGAGAIVAGQISQHVSLTPFVSQTFDATFPAGTCKNIDLEPGMTGAAPPGRYCQIAVKTGATLLLTSGNYYIDTLNPIEPQAALKIDDSTGPVRLFIQSPFDFRGAISGSSSTPDILFAVIGSGTVSIESAFSGTVISPSATLNLSASRQTISGAFFASDIVVQPDIVIQQHSVSDLRLCDDHNACTSRDVLEQGACVGHNPVTFGVPESSPSLRCSDGTLAVGCRAFDCNTGLPTSTWLGTPACGTPPSCTAVCPAGGCLAANARTANVVACSCSCTDPANGSSLLTTVQACSADAAPDCGAICARGPESCSGDACVVQSCSAVAGTQPATILAKSCRPEDGGATSSTSPYTASINQATSRVAVNIGGKIVSAPIAGTIAFSLPVTAPPTFILSSLSAAITGPVNLFGRQINALQIVSRRQLGAHLAVGPSGASQFSLGFRADDLTAQISIAGTRRFLSLDAMPAVTGTLSADKKTLILSGSFARSNGDTLALTLSANVTNAPPVPTIAISPSATLECSGNRRASATLNGSAADPNPGDTISRFQWLLRDPAAMDRQLSVLGGGPSLGAALPLGARQVVLYVYDNHQAAGRAQIDVTVQDTITPVIHAPPDETVYVGSEGTGATVNLGSPSITEACDPAPSIEAITVANPDAGLGSFPVDPGDVDLPLGTTTITWRVTDEAGNVGTATQTVTVLAQEAPSGALPPLPIVVSAPEMCGATPVSPPGSPPVQVDLRVCVVGVINGNTREGTPAWASCSDDNCANQNIQSFLGGINDIYSGFVQFNYVGFKRIRDPAPPGSSDDCVNTGEDFYGDVCLAAEFGGSAGAEGNTMVDDCFAAWGYPHPNRNDTCIRSIVLVMARAATANQTCGVATAAFPDPPNPGSPDYCTDPRVVPNNTSGAFAIAETSTAGPFAIQCDPTLEVAHELGHALGLDHGDGLDNDCNGVWDTKCDSAEVDTGPATLMAPYGGTLTRTLTALQSDRARIFGTKSAPTFGNSGDNCPAVSAPTPPADTGPTGGGAAGCGCATSGQADSSFASLLALLALLARSRRRSRCCR